MPLVSSAPVRGERLETADMVAVARAAGYTVKPRLITDWVSLGLLDKPDQRGRGRGKGKQYTWPPSQGRLLVTLLNKRAEGVGRITLTNVPVVLWLIWGEGYVPLRQASKALATWCQHNQRVGPTASNRTIDETLKQLDHPDATPEDRDNLRGLLESAAYGNVLDRD